MSNCVGILIAGFGGQGVLFFGKALAYGGLYAGKEVSWLPSYGPEMRGGTANCSVTISDEAIGSPLITAPDVLVAMNLPSLEKFIDSVVPGGTVIVESSLINKKIDRTDINVFYVPATSIVEKNGLKGLANIVLLGKTFKETTPYDYKYLEMGIAKCVPPKKAHLLEPNLKAIKLGMEL